MLLKTECICNIDSCFESALFLSAPKMEVPTQYHNRNSNVEITKEDYEGLIDKDLLQEINKCCTQNKALKDITEKEFNSCTAYSNDTTKKGFTFPNGGWVCSLCKNYNFSGRIQCNRCNKKKSKEDFRGKPDHLRRLDDPSQEVKKKKALNIRDGDWNCPSCDNINFAFRLKCNKCKKEKSS